MTGGLSARAALYEVVTASQTCTDILYIKLQFISRKCKPNTGDELLLKEKQLFFWYAYGETTNVLFRKIPH